MRLFVEIFRAWGDFKGSMRRQISSNPREAKLLAFAMLAGLFGFLARVPIEMLELENGVDSIPILWSLLVSGLFFAPLFFYLIAGLSGLFLRIFGQKVDYKDMRLAFFWTLLVSAPLMFLTSLTSWPVFAELQTVATISKAIGFIAFLYIWYSMVTVVIANKI